MSEFYKNKRWHCSAGYLYLFRETGKIYHQENYVANILFQSNIQNRNVLSVSKIKYIKLYIFSQYSEGTTFNVSGEVTVCSNRSTITVTCEGGLVEVDLTSCHWNRDGSLNYTGGVFGVHQNMRRGEYSVTDNGTVLVCVHGRIGQTGGAFNAFNTIISFTLNLISIVCLTATLVTYILFKQLRNLPGLNLMCLAASILLTRVE